MADNAERRYRAAMDKLFFSPSKQSTSFTGIPSSSGSNQDGFQSSRSELYQRTPTGQQRNKASTVPICRPWDRGDLMRRLATFKSITWFAKPKVVSPVNCARRGWINVEADTLECEACGSRLLFSTPSSWTSQQVENSAAVFSLKLDSGHKSICPWKDNICDEHLTQFPPTPPVVLVESFRDRCKKLSHLSALPIVSSAVIEDMNGPQLDWFLAQSSPPASTIISGDITSTIQSRDLEDESASAVIYHKAQKVISLYGWDPRVLPYVVDCQDQTRSAEDVSVSKVSGKASQEQSPGIPFITGVDKVTEQDEVSSLIDDQEVDPASVVLDCKLCGACVGLWAFSAVSRPLQLFNFIESPDTTIGRNESGVSAIPEASFGGDAGKESLQTSANTVATSCKQAAQEKGALCLNLTIAGGPPPAKQNFRATVSLPIISRHLKAGIWCSSDARKDIIPIHSKQHSEVPGVSNANKLQNTQAGDISVEPVGTLKRKGADDDTTISNSNNELLKGQAILEQDPSKMENSLRTRPTVNAVEGFCNERTIEPVEDVLEFSGKVEVMDISAEDASDTTKKARLSFQVPECCDSTQDNGQTGKDDQIGGISFEDVGAAPNQIDGATQTANELCHGRVSAENKGTNDTSHHLLSSSHSEDGAVDKECELNLAMRSNGNITGIRNEDADVQNPPAVIAVKKANVNAHSSGKILEVTPWDKTMEFDPIRQHRHFCPWITSSSGSGKRGLAGWQLTLSALEQEKDAACESSPVVSCSTGPRYEGEDPISVIRKLFRSGSAKRPISHR